MQEDPRHMTFAQMNGIFNVYSLLLYSVKVLIWTLSITWIDLQNFGALDQMSL